ncbi:MAG: hypothetical protein AB7S26_34070 [Sandaracinaceae bacterium]
MKNAILTALVVLLFGGMSAYARPVSAQTGDGSSDDAASDDAASDDSAGDDGASDDAAASDDDAGDDDDDGATDDDTASADPEPEVSQGTGTTDAGTTLNAPTGTTAPDPAAGTGTSDDSSTEPSADEEDGTSGEEVSEEELEAADPALLPWRNTYFTWNHQATFNSFLRDAQLSYNPYYQQSFTISPRWYLTNETQIRGSLSLSVEITDTDDNALNRDPQVSDPSLSLFHTVVWEDFIFQPNFRLTFPLSKASIAAQRYISLGAGIQVVRVIPEAANLTIAGIFRYQRWFAGSNVVRTGTPQPDQCGRATPQMTSADAAPDIPTAFCDQLGTASSSSDIILAGISATMTPVGPFSINLSAFMYTLYGFGLAPWVSDDGQIVTRETPLVIEDGSPSHWRNFTYISLSVAYQFTSWLNISLGIQNSGNVAPLYNSDGSIRNPLFTPDTQVFLSATLGLDTIYNELFGQERELTPQERQRRQQGLASGPTTGGAF